MRMTMWRQLLYQEIETIKLDGSILDLGGSRTSRYHSLLKGEHSIDVANLDNGEDKEYNFNFEDAFPIESEKYDGIICLNVLEHIFNHQNFLNESFRILKSGSTVILGVPFIMQYHPSPNDYWRYTEPTLHKIFTKAGFQDVQIRLIGTGIFSASYSIVHNAVRFGLLQSFCIWIARMLDALVYKIAPDCFLTKKYYPLGFVIVANKK